jgi:hypothetical protein
VLKGKLFDKFAAVLVRHFPKISKTVFCLSLSPSRDACVSRLLIISLFIVSKLSCEADVL